MPASQRLLGLAAKLERRIDINLGELLDILGSAGVGFTIILLALPVLFPVPGPWGVVLGGCLAAVSLQLLLGASQPWFPAWIRKRNLPIETLKAMIRRSVPWLQWIETHMRPGRLKRLTGAFARTLMGIPLLLLAVALSLPLPFGNFMPVLAFIMFGLAFLERDGLAVIVALLLTVLALIWTAVLIFLGVEIFNAFIEWLGMDQFISL